MQVKVLGPGCSNCKKVYQIAEQAIAELQKEAELIYVTDLVEISKTGLMRTPGLMINDKIVSYGRIPSVDEVKEFMMKA
ncbi:MAG: thioredoxin family protein [Acholeplasmataceae bacterium]|jgi:small redox-active disulfide protein 2|nr:thioredoxin family protein [Acholeplasmataceae bacterium]